MDVFTYIFKDKKELYKSIGNNKIHNAARLCLANFYDTHSDVEFINAKIKISSNKQWNVDIKTSFRCSIEEEKVVVTAIWNKDDNYKMPTFTRYIELDIS